MIDNIQIKDFIPEKVYVFPKKLTKEEINDNVSKLHTIANQEADRTIYCLFDEVVMDKAIKFEVCFPVNHLDLKKYKKSDFRVLQREKVVSAEFSGDFNKLTDTIAKLTEFANNEGFQVKPPYRYLFTLHKKPMFSKEPQQFTLEIQIPLVID